MHFLFLSIIFRSLSTICAKQAALTSMGAGVWGILLNYWLVAEVIMLIAQAFCWALVLRRLPITLAYPFMSLAVGLNLAAASFIFKEQVEPQNIIGVAIIVFGVFVMNFKQRS